MNIDELQGNVDRLKELQQSMIKAIYEAGDIIEQLKRQPETRAIAERAYAYWVGIVSSNIDPDSNWVGGSMTNMFDTINQLQELIEAEKDPDDGYVSMGPGYDHFETGKEVHRGL